MIGIGISLWMAGAPAPPPGGGNAATITDTSANGADAIAATLGRAATIADTSANGSDAITADAIAPTVSSIANTSAGTFIDITFSENMDQTSTPAAGDFALGGTQATVGSVAWQSATVLRVTVASFRMMGSSFETITISYTQGTNKIRDLALNNLANFSAQAVTNNSIHAPMVQIETLYASGNWTAPTDLYGTTCLIEWFPAGEGGATAQGSGASGGYANKTDTIAAGGVYAYTIGAAGAAGWGAGGDCTWRTNVCVAAGGGSATAQVGDVTRAQTARVLGAGTVSATGAPGTTSAGSGSAPGAPNGGPGGTSGNLSTRRPGSGGGSTGSAQRIGAAGLGRVTCLRAPPLTGPYVVAVAEYRDTALATSRALPVTGTHQAGDAAIAESSLTGAATPSCVEATFSHTTSLATTLHASVFAFDCDGTDSFTVASSSSAGAYRVSRIRGSAGAATVEATGSTGTISGPTPVIHTPSGGSLERQVFVAAACTALASQTTHSISGHPAGYLGPYTPQDVSISSTGSAGLVSGSKRESAVSYTPGAFASSIASWACVTASIE